MTRSNTPDDRNQDMARQLRDLNRRVERLEYVQISPQEFTRSFDRVYDEIDALEEHMNERFDRVNDRFDRVNDRFDRVNDRFDRVEGQIAELNRKFDIVMQHITGQAGTS